jgi:hypothetical protein
LTIPPAETSRASAEAHRVAVLGAPGTGKTRLATELLAALGSGPFGATAILVTDAPPLAAVARGFDRVLLMGLDLPAPHAARLAQDNADRQLRQALAKTDLPYTVVYGTGSARLANALGALHGLAGCGNPQLPPAHGAHTRRPWVWACDTCSDPDCERRLLSDLLASRALGPSA